ncbi:MAG: PQQ-like beta-propeller repeat protein [bacterium]|nr:PQQ-like beta-propeller repeat protein [bacterium]
MLPTCHALCATFLGLVLQDAPIWPDYRGPGLDGHAPEAEVPLEWSEKEGVQWKTPIPGRGWSTPVVHRGEAWMTTATPKGDRLSVLAVDVDTGAIVHRAVLFEVEEPQERSKLNSYASPSAVIAEGRVWVHYGAEGTACIDTETRKVLWRRTDLRCDHMEGPGSSPLLVDGKLVINVDGGDVQYVVALEAETGETAWRVERSASLAPLVADFRKAYSTPILVEGKRSPLVLSSGARRTSAFDPDDGREVWYVDHPGFSMSSRPVTDGKRVFLTTGFMRSELWAVRLGGKGDVTKSHVLWKHKKNVPTMPSAVLIDGYLYLVDDGSIASCIDAKNGNRMWRERIDGDHSSSPVYAGGRLYFFDREGKSTVIAPSKKFQVLARNELDDGMMASPVVVGDSFLLRTRTHLYRIATPGE